MAGKGSKKVSGKKVVKIAVKTLKNKQSKKSEKSLGGSVLAQAPGKKKRKK